MLSVVAVVGAIIWLIVTGVAMLVESSQINEHSRRSPNDRWFQYYTPEQMGLRTVGTINIFHAVLLILALFNLAEPEDIQVEKDQAEVEQPVAQ